jgi:hypothetical protein
MGSKNDPLQTLEVLERWSGRATLLIFAGILVEMALVVYFRHEEWLGSFVANALIGIGLIAEYIVIARTIVASGEVQRLAGEKVAQALERASRADLARVELEAKLAPRSLSEEQFTVLQTLRGKVSKLIVTTPSDFESTRFGYEVARTLAAAGIEVYIGPQRIGMVWSNVYLVFPEPVANFWDEPLFVAFKNAGLSVGAGDRSKTPMGDLAADVPVVMVGEKAISYPQVPHALAVVTESEPK